MTFHMDVTLHAPAVNLAPVPIKTYTPMCGYGQAGVQVWVAPENPSVTCANP